MRKARSLSAVSFVVACAASVACSTSPANPECDCADGAVMIHIPGDQAASAQTPVLSMTCEDSQLTCTQQASAGGCSLWEFGLDKIGPDCHVEVAFANGHVFVADFAVTQSTGCCAGYYASPLSAGDVEASDGS